VISNIFFTYFVFCYPQVDNYSFKLYIFIKKYSNSLMYR